MNERQQLQSELRLAHKLESLGTQTRLAIERRLGRVFRDHAVVKRVATEILANAG